MNDIRPQTFHSILYYFFTVLAGIGILNILKDMVLILIGYNTNILTISVPFPYSFLTVLVSVFFVCLSWYVSRKHKKLAKDLKFR